MQDDPAYRVKVIQAERLTRLNHLGPMNDTLAQNTARRDPEWKPEGEPIAQFWDMPTPFAGMRPEAEKEYVGLLRRSGTAKQFFDFGTARGFGMDLEQVAEWTAVRDKAAANGRSIRIISVTPTLSRKRR